MNRSEVFEVVNCIGEAVICVPVTTKAAQFVVAGSVYLPWRSLSACGYELEVYHGVLEE